MYQHGTLLVFFFRQKTAYEMRIIDWSSDVCSSDISFDMAELVDDVLSNHAREFERHGIQLRLSRPDSPMPVKAVKGMVIQILENLVSNSAYWLKQQERFEPGFMPELRVQLDADEKTLTIEDNGPGVPEDRAERVLAPFLTTKHFGQGREIGREACRERGVWTWR